MSELKRTPLFEEHQKLGGKIVGFAGWELPVQYSGVIAEHNAVRSAAGLFDVSHMGEIFVSGPQAEAALNALTCNDVSKLVDGKAHYSAITNERGGVVDDIIIYRYNPQFFLVCVNASNSDRDFEWLTKHNKFDAKIENKSAEFGQIALQGPKAEEILSKLEPKCRTLQYFHFLESEVAGIPTIIARTGYTGEDGFELFVPSAQTAAMWRKLLEVGAPNGLIPCGLGARDSLRLEACYPLHGHELSEDISAIESGIGWVVKLDKGDFTGREKLAAERANGAARALIGFIVEDPGIVRENEKLFSTDGQEIGYSTSGTKTPTIGKALGMALVKKSHSEIGSEFLAEVRGRKLRCRVVKKPFYTKPK